MEAQSVSRSSADMFWFDRRENLNRLRRKRVIEGDLASIPDCSPLSSFAKTQIMHSTPVFNPAAPRLEVG